jgi:hypothetical protein
VAKLIWRKAVAQILWPVPEATVTVLCTPEAYFGHVGGRLLLRYYDLYQRLHVTVLCTPDDGCDGHPKHVE